MEVSVKNVSSAIRSNPTATIQSHTSSSVFLEQRAIASRYQVPSADQIVPLWIENCYAASTRRAYVSEWRRFERFCRSKELSSSLKDIRPSTLTNYLTSRSLAESTKRTSLITYRSLFAFAKRCGYRGISPAHLLRCPWPNETIHERILSENDLEKMLQCAKTKRVSTSHGCCCC